jgi:cell division protein FtsZ
MAPRLLQTEDASGSNGPIFFDLDISSGKPIDNKLEKKEENGKIEWVLTLPTVSGNFSSEPSGPSGNKTPDQLNSSSSAASGGYLAKPANIYAENETKKSAPAHEPLKGVVGDGASKSPKEEDPSQGDMQLIIKDAPSAADEPRAHQTPPSVSASDSVEEPAPQDETEELKRRAAERMQKLRNLSFNVNAADPNNEFETVPAYVRRNLELYNTYSSVENFYSNYEVRKDDDQSARISTLNSFLDGKKPD